MNNLFIKGIKIDEDIKESFKDTYPYNIPVIKNFDSLEFNKPVTFFVGENGVGKSTFIEALAVSLGLPAEGGTQNFKYQTTDTHSRLHEHLVISKFSTPKTKFFLRTESFYNFSSEMQRLVEEDHYTDLLASYGGLLHECSHGESFLRLVQNRFTDKGLYILDEPEAALSPQRQMSLLCMIDDLVKHGSQFIIATHSPILISYRDGEIRDLNKNFEIVDFKDTDIYNIYKMYLDNPEGMQRNLLD